MARLLGCKSCLWESFCFDVLCFAPSPDEETEGDRKAHSVRKDGDRVLAAGGIYGTVANLKDTIVILKVADNVKLEVLRSSITSVEKASEEKPAS